MQLYNLQQRTYHSEFYTGEQCRELGWDREKMITCYGNNFGGILGGTTRKDCMEESVWGYPIKLWLDKITQNNNGGDNTPLQCLKLFLETDEQFLSSQQSHQSYDIMQTLEEVSANLETDKLFDHLIMGTFNMNGFGTIWDWNTIVFCEYVSIVLTSLLLRSGSSNSNNKTITFTLAVDTTKRLEAILTNGTESFITECVDALIPPLSDDDNANTTASEEEHRLWKERGFHLRVSTMVHSSSGLLKSLSGSLRGVLPPPPTALYSVNSVLGGVSAF